MSRSRFPAKIDWGISLILACLAILSLGLGIVCFFLPSPTYFGGVLLILTGALMQSIWMRTFNEIDQQQVHVQCGPLWWNIPLAHIHSVEKTSSIWLMMGGPHLRFALSHDGLMIRYQKTPGHKWLGLWKPAVLISPAERDPFLSALQLARPDLTRGTDGSLGAKE